MRRSKGVLSLAVLVVAVAIFPPPAGACVWCNPDQWLDFQDCLYWGIRNEPVFGQLQVSDLVDFKNSMLAASGAITKASSSMKMIVGAMAGELAELLKLLSDDGGPKAVMMNIVRVCHVDVTGRPDLGFMDELDRTLDFMMKLPSYDNPESVPDDNNGFPQDANPTNFNGQNINSPPDFNNMRQPQSKPSTGTINYSLGNAVPYRGNNQQAPSGIMVPNNQNAGSSLPAQTIPGQRNINAASLSYTSQTQNGASGFNTFNQNPSVNPSITNANAASNSYSVAQSANLNPGSRPYPLNPGYSNQPQITNTNAASSANSYNLANANTISNTDQNIPQNNVPNQFPPRDFSPISIQGPSNPTNNLQNQQIPSQSINQPQNSFTGSETKTFQINAQNVPQKYQENQFNQYPASNLNVLGQSGGNIQRPTNQYNVGTSPYNELPPNNDYWLPNQNYPNNPAVNTPSTPPSSGLSAIQNSNGNFPDNYPAVTSNMPKNGKKLQNGTPDSKKQRQSKINGVTNQKSLQPSPNDDDIARAIRFAETIYVILSQSNIFKNVFNEQIPNDQALSLVYKLDVGALNDCGYSRFSVEIANACTVLIQSLPDGCSFVQYAEAVSKVVMDQLNMKKLIGENPEDQAKCIANNILSRLQNIYPIITTTTMQPPLPTNADSNFFQGPGSQSQLTNANSDGYSSYQNPDIKPQLINSNGARIYRPNADQNIPQNNLQNQFLPGNDVPINNAVPSNLINKPQNQLNFGPGPVNQQPDSSAIATNKNIGANPNLQNTGIAYNGEGINNAATIFYQKLFKDLLSCPYMSRIYNEGTTKTEAKTITATLLLGSLSADYDKLAPEITKECIKRLGSMQTGSNTELYAAVIARCITDGFFYYGLISQEAPLAQASDISSKMIAWLTNNGNNNQQANRNTDVQSNLANQGAMNYPDSYPGVPNLIQGQQLVSSEILASNSGGITDYNPNTDNLGPQYLPYDNQNFDSNSPPITNDGLQNIRTYSDANSSSVSTNINSSKNKNANKINKKKSKKSKKKKTTASKTNFNFDNLNDYPVNNAVKSKPNSPPDLSNGNNLRDYNGNVNYQPNNVPNTQWSGFQNYPAQNINSYYDLTSGAATIQNDNIPGLQQSALPSGVNNSPGKKKCKKLKSGKGSDAANNPFTGDDMNTSNYPLNLWEPSALDMTNNPPKFQSDNYAGPPSNGYDAVPNQNTSPVSPQSQIIPDERNDEVKDRIMYLTKGVLSSLTSGKFDYRLFSDIMAEVSQNLQTTYPKLGSEISFIKTLIDSIVACTQLLKKVPKNYFDDIVLQNSDIPDAAAIDYSNSIPPVQGDQGPTQTNQNNRALDDQSNGPLALPQKSNLNNAQTGNFYPGGSAPLSNSNVSPTRQGSVNNVALNDQSYGLPTPPQQNYLNNDQIGNVYLGGSAPLPSNNVPPPRQGSVNNVALNDQSYVPPTLPQQNNLNNAQIGNFYPGDSTLLQNTNVPPPRQGTVNNNQNYGPPTLLQQSNFNQDQIGQRNFYSGGSAPLLDTNVPPPGPVSGIQRGSQGVGGNILSNALAIKRISSKLGQDNFPPTLPNGYGRQNLPLNNQNGLAF